MGLPISQLPTTEIEINGETIKIRALSRREAFKLAEFKDDPDAGEAFILSCATGDSIEAANYFRDNSDTDTVGKLIDAVIDFSGLATKPEADPDNPKA